MRIHVGCELSFEFPQTKPMIATLNVHFSRVSELERPDYLITNPSVPIEGYRDSFGNWCSWEPGAKPCQDRLDCCCKAAKLLILFAPTGRS
jgi:hypothetical protein